MNFTHVIMYPAHQNNILPRISIYGYFGQYNLRLYKFMLTFEKSNLLKFYPYDII